MTFLCDNPWMFHRDEIDLLEEEIDELYRQHESANEDSVSQMEMRLLKEQLDSEELSEAELTLQLGPEYLLSHPHVCDPGDNPDDNIDAAEPDESVLQSLRESAYRDPLYSRIYLWAQQVFAYASKRYVAESVRDEGMFRAYLNVKMIPIKFVAFQTERLSGDSIGEQIAKKEGALCLTYFERTLNSLEHHAFLGDEEAAMLVQEGKEIELLAKKELV